MKVTIAIVPPGGGETDYGFNLELSAVPSPGDYIVVRTADGRSSDFIVRRRWFFLERQGSQELGFTESGITVEAEFALSQHSSEEHRRACDAYKGRGKPLQEFQATMY